MGACTSTNQLARSIDHNMCKTIAYGQSSDIKEPEHYTEAKREEIKIRWKEKMLEVGAEASTQSVLTSSQLTDKSCNISTSSLDSYRVFNESGTISKNFSKSTAESITDFSCWGWEDLVSRKTECEIGLHWAKTMINYGTDPKTLVTDGDRNCLICAVLANDFDFVKKLVKLGVNVNKTNSLGETALDFAKELNRYNIASYLREHGASTSTSSHFIKRIEKTTSSSAVRHRLLTDSCLSSIDYCKSTTESITESSYKGSDGLNKRTINRYEIGLQMLKAMINSGADPKKLVTHGNRNCLMFAVLAEDFDFVKKLVKLGVNVNKTNSTGESALGFANELGRYDIASYLREHGASVE